MGFANRRKTILRIAALASVIGTYALLVTQILRVDEFILRPNRAAVELDGASRHLIGSGDRQVEVVRARPSSARDPVAFLLHFPGNEARAEAIVHSVAELWGHDDTETWCVNYPGSGGSTGDAQIAELAPAALAAFDELHRVANGRPIVLSGNCLGATVALHVAAERNVAGVVLQNPAPLRELVRSRFRGPVLWFLAYPVSFQIPDALDPIASAARCRERALFIRSTGDRDIPPHMQAKVFDTYAGEKRLLELAGDHATSPSLAGTELRDALNWLRYRSHSCMH